MTRATWALAATTAVGLAAAGWLYLDNRALRAELADLGRPAAPAAARPAADAWLDARPAPAAPVRTGSGAAVAAGPGPALPETPSESRMDRRARRTLEFGAMFGRHDGETDDEYRARVTPLVTAGLAIPRERAADMRRQAEAKAQVTPEQSARLDQAFEKIHGDVLDYTNKAVTDGQLSPYERNVAGWLDYAGGLGGILGEAQGQVGKILAPEQVRAMYDAGFEWGEYLGLTTPWERVTPPPAQRR